jgi:hypothetical protein
MNGINQLLPVPLDEAGFEFLAAAYFIDTKRTQPGQRDEARITHHP